MTTRKPIHTFLASKFVFSFVLIMLEVQNLTSFATIVDREVAAYLGLILRLRGVE